MDEKVFLDVNGVTVTSARFTVSSQTYAMSGITSVKSYVRRPSRRPPIALFAMGGIAVLSGKDGLVFFAIILIIIGVLWWVQSKTEYQVRLRTASGEATALRSQNSNWIDQVVKALNEAIIHRG